jgi:hypothetical protein
MRPFTTSEIRNFWATKWKEAREESYALNLGNTTASATLVGYIDAEDYALAVASILGYSICQYNNRDNSLELYRVAPVCHPRVRNLYASAVRITPYAFIEAGKPMNPYENKEVSPVYTFTYINAPRLTESFNVVRYTSHYKKLRVEIDFSEFVGVTFASNDQPNFIMAFANSEYLRYSQILFDYNLEVLQMDNAASLVFDAGPPINQAFPTPVGVVLPQGKLYIKWMWVPHEFISDPIPGMPINFRGKVLYNKTIHETLGKVNLFSFLGFEAGELLFTSWKTEPIVIPVPDAETNSVSMELAWNIDFEFLYLNTKAEATYQIEPPWANEWRFRGHNVFPYRGDGKFYPASIRKGGEPVPGKPLYNAKKFEEMFYTYRRPNN